MLCLSHWCNNRATWSVTVSGTLGESNPPTLDEWLVVGGYNSVPEEGGRMTEIPVGRNSLRCVKCTAGGTVHRTV